MQLLDPLASSMSAAYRRSIYSMVKFWNALPESTVRSANVKLFQSAIQHSANLAVEHGMSISDVCKLKFIHVPFSV